MGMVINEVELRLTKENYRTSELLWCISGIVGKTDCVIFVVMEKKDQKQKTKKL